MSDFAPGACRYCGILPDQDLPRPSYHDLRAERDRLRGRIGDMEALLADTKKAVLSIMDEANEVVTVIWERMEAES